MLAWEPRLIHAPTPLKALKRSTLEKLDVFVCYLDDSGKDPKNPITTLAGYVARDAAWSLFERNVEPVFKEFGVEVLHARDLHNTDRDFKGWRRVEKEKFVSRVCEAMAPQVPFGISFSVDKKIYEARRKESRAQGVPKCTPYTYCLRVIIDWLLEQAEIRAVGVSFVLECGHQNNTEARLLFEEVRRRHGLEGVLGTISFHAKQDSYAIQLADLFAYYSRRRVKRIEEHQTPEPEPILAILPRGVCIVVKDVFSD